MSILIKGLEMPEAGDHVLLLHVYHDGTASIIGDHRHYKNEPFEIVPVPPHGRLIDADAIMTKLNETSKRVFGNDSIPECSALSIVADYIESAPTIIPAEEE